MELSEQSVLEELLAPNHEFLPNGWNFESPFYQNPEFVALNSSLLGLISTTAPHEPNFQEPYHPFLDSLLPLQENECYNNNGMLENQDFISSGDFHHGFTSNIINDDDGVKVEEAAENSRMKNKVKKIEGQPSKNLMAERRRRKRLNDRLSMLRSIVPKISKMDRTAILGDTIDYMKELLEKIHTLREDDDDHVKEEIKDIKFVGNSKELKPNEALVRKPPKFDVERRNVDTRIEICCAPKPGLLLSTVSTLETLGLDVQQCVISCFSDFSMQASCSEAREHRTVLSSEDVKQTLFKTAGYGGTCL